MLKGMRIGIGVNANAGPSDVVAAVVRAEEAGFSSAWLAQIFSNDALTLLALAGSSTGRIELGTAVVPTHSRHPLYMAQQALTTQAACDGRLLLGLGPSHKLVIENMLGLSYARPARHVQEYVEIVRALAEEGKVSYQGELYRVQGQVAVKGAKPFPILIGALGARMRKIAGTIADGTITWMAGTAALRDTLIPDINAAAVGAGRPAPRIVASIPVALTADRDAARSVIDEALAIYPQLPSYKAVLDLGGASRPSDVAVIGDETAIESALGELAEAGVTDLVPQPFPVGTEPKANLARLHQLLAELARR